MLDSLFTSRYQNLEIVIVDTDSDEAKGRVKRDFDLVSYNCNLKLGLSILMEVMDYANRVRQN